MKNTGIRETVIVAFVLTLFSVLEVHAQTDEVTIVTQGQGSFKQEAIQSALRSAVEQAFGVFVSSRTELLNDELAKDDIITISNGNIKQYEVLSESPLSSEKFLVTVKSTVSVSNLQTFCASKGIEAEIKGGLFALNIKQKLLNERAELAAIYNMCDVALKYSE